MRVNFKKQIAIIMTCIGSLIWDGVASADGWPTILYSSGGWTAFVDGSERGLSVYSFATAPGQCSSIVGSFSGDISGFYCPGSGRIGFILKNGSGIPVEYYSGNVSQDSLTGVVYMAGSVINLDIGINKGEYKMFEAWNRLP